MSSFPTPADDGDCEDGSVDWEAPIPDAVDLVVEADVMMSVHAAQRYERIEAMRYEALADARRHGRQLTDIIERSVRLELAAALSITESAAGTLITQADALVNRYPSALDSLAHARFTQRHAVLLAEALDGIEPRFRDDLLPRAIILAESLPVGTFGRKLRALIDSVRAVTLEERHRDALQTRRIFVQPGDDAMATLMAFVPAVEAHAIANRLTATAKLLSAQPGETRTLDQLRADIFGDILIDGVTEALPPEARGIRATVFVTVPVLALLGVEGEGDRFATVEGVGPIPLDRARELCGSAAGWTRVLTHPETGMVLSVGRTRYRPPPDLRRLVRWRAERCMGPGCGMPASRCEIDHNIPWQAGGVTSLANLTPFCKNHHIVKHHGGWAVEQVADSGGAVRWTSPSGREYLVEPERRVPVFRPVAVDPPPPF